jgi:hypothetical protein
LESILELLATTVTSSSVNSKEDDGSWADANFSRLNDLEALRQFLFSSNYLLEGFDSDDESHDPSLECFMCDGEFHEGTPNENEGEHTSANAMTRNTTRAFGATMPPPVGQLQPQLEQLRELERKLEEERQQLAQLHAAFE